jgi:hypothetical protein
MLKLLEKLAASPAQSLVERKTHYRRLNRPLSNAGKRKEYDYLAFMISCHFFFFFVRFYTKDQNTFKREREGILKRNF